MDEAFIKRRCYLKLGDGAILSFIRLRADCFFRHWSLKAPEIDEEGYVRASAMASYPHRRQVSEVALRVDPVTSFLIEYRYIDQGSPHIFALIDGEYVERETDGREAQRTSESSSCLEIMRAQAPPLTRGRREG